MTLHQILKFPLKTKTNFVTGYKNNGH